MNVERCVALHNEIVTLGWIGSGRSMKDLDSHTKNWFELHAQYGQDAEDARPNLSSDLVQFLEQTKHISAPNEDIAFFYWVQGISSRDFMFDFPIDDFAPENDVTTEIELSTESRGDFTRYIVLYAMHHFGSHLCGLIYNQHTHKCIISPTIHDMEPIWDKRTKWYPLDEVLEFWLGQMRRGLIKAVPEGWGEHPDEHNLMEEMRPWVYLSYSETMIKENLFIFDQLVDAIESRMPVGSILEADQIEYGLAREPWLSSTRLPPGFAYEFLKRARRPRFKLIAPGLRLTTFADLSQQPFASYFPSHDCEIPPILLFEHDYARWSDSWVTASCTAFSWPYSEVHMCSAGLYLHPTHKRSSSKACPEDAFLFVLPYAIGANGYARKSDGSHFGENLGTGCEEAYDSAVDLYRLGHHPLQEMREQSLSDVLKSWLGMVERGDWNVDEHGVAGGIDIWRQADTKDAWQKYFIPREI